MGKITDILLATVVIEMPVLRDENAIRKNIIINSIPIMVLMGSHWASLIT